MIKAIIINTKELGQPVCRLLVWRDGALVILKTHASEYMAITQLHRLKQDAAYFARLQAEGV